MQCEACTAKSASVAAEDIESLREVQQILQAILTFRYHDRSFETQQSLSDSLLRFVHFLFLLGKHVAFECSHVSGEAQAHADVCDIASKLATW